MSTKTARTRARAGGIALAAGVTAATLARSGRTRILRWGASDEEVAESLPGDNLIVSPSVTATRAITVRRSAEVVWPWIAQLGQGRGGFYSYDFLENLLGCDMHSADRVVPEWQQLEVGDEVRLAPKAGLKVAIVEPGRALVLQGSVPLGRTPPFDSSWAFVLSEQPDGSTRLISRERYSYKLWWAPLVVEPTQVMSFVMSRKMLLGIRERAERGAEPKVRRELHDVGSR